MEKIYWFICNHFESIVTIFVALWVVHYTANKNRRQEKYFKLQKVSEEVILHLWKRQDTLIKYQEIKEKLDIGSNPMDWTSWYSDPEIQKMYNIKYNELNKEFEKVSNLKQEYHNIIFSKIHVYFSEFWLTSVRDKSALLSRLLANKNFDIYDKDQNDRFLDICVELKETIIIKVKRYWRSGFKDLFFRFTEKYNILSK